MAGKDLNYRINVNAAAGTAGIRDFGRAVKSELKSVDSSLDDTSTAAQKVAQSLGRMADQAETELRQAAKAADALGQALGPELAAKMGRDGIVEKIADFNRLGLTFEQIEADADELAASIKRIDDVQTSAQDQGLGALGSKVKSTRGEVDGLTDSADKSRNAMANMVGNSAQDLGAFAGVAGSAGVALGQLAEGAADAKFGGEGLVSSLKSVGTIAGPVAALALVMQSLGDITARFGDSAKRQAANVDAWSQAMTKGGTAAENYAENLADIGAVTVDLTRSQSKLTNVVAEASDHWYSTGIGVEVLARALGAADDETKDITASLNRAGVSAADWVQAIAGTPEATARFAASLAATNTSAEEQQLILLALTQQQEDYAVAAQATEDRQRFLAAETGTTTRAFQEQEHAVDAERQAHLRNNEALYSSTLRFAEVRTAAERAADMAIHLAHQFDAIRASLDMDAAIQTMNDDFVTAMATVADKTALTGDEILALKRDILNVADYANLNPIQVKALMQAIDDGNIRGVLSIAQQQIDRTRLTAKVELQLAQGQTSTGRIGGIPIARALPPDPSPGGLAVVDPAAASSEPATSSSYDLGTITATVAGAPGNVTVDMRGAFIAGSRYDVIRMVRTATRDGVRLAGSRT